MKKIFLLILCMLFAQNIIGQDIRKPLSENEIKLSKTLKNDKEFLQVGCSLGKSQGKFEGNSIDRLKTYESFIKKGQK